MQQHPQTYTVHYTLNIKKHHMILLRKSKGKNSICTCTIKNPVSSETDKLKNSLISDDNQYGAYMLHF